MRIFGIGLVLLLSVLLAGNIMAAGGPDPAAGVPDMINGDTGWLTRAGSGGAAPSEVYSADSPGLAFGHGYQNAVSSLTRQPESRSSLKVVLSSSWKTYTTGSFSFSYPSGMSVSTSSDTANTYYLMKGGTATLPYVQISFSKQAYSGKTLSSLVNANKDAIRSVFSDVTFIASGDGKIGTLDAQWVVFDATTTSGIPVRMYGTFALSQDRLVQVAFPLTANTLSSTEGQRILSSFSFASSSSVPSSVTKTVTKTPTKSGLTPTKTPTRKTTSVPSGKQAADTSGWPTYRTAWFTMKYPSEYSVEVLPQSTSTIYAFRDPSSTTVILVSVSSGATYGDLTLSDIRDAADELARQEEGFSLISSEMTRLGSIQAFKMVFTDSSNGYVTRSLQVGTLRNGRLFMVLAATRETLFDTKSPLFQGMVSSFRFAS